MPPQLLLPWDHEDAVGPWGRRPRRTCMAGGVKTLRYCECRSWDPSLTASSQQCARLSSGLHAATAAASLGP